MIDQQFSYRNQSNNLEGKSTEWFLYVASIGHLFLWNIQAYVNKVQTGDNGQTVRNNQINQFVENNKKTTDYFK